jgi:glycosyltransferase involved in cell wall biosynthesis
VKLEVWSPLPPARSGVADHVAESLPALARRAQVALVAEDPASVDTTTLSGVPLRAPHESDPKALRVYELGNSRWHGFVYREALRRPGVLRLHEWSLHGLVLAETFLRGDEPRYRRLMREAYGPTGSFVAGQVAAGFCSPVLESLFPLCEHLLARSLGVAATTCLTLTRVRATRPGLPAAHVPLHAAVPAALPSREEARARLGLPPEAFVVTAPGLVNPLKRLDAALSAAGRLRRAGAPVHVVVAGENAPKLPLAAWAEAAGLAGAFTLTGRVPLETLEWHLAAADAVLALRFPTLGEMSAVLLRAMAAARPVLVTAGTPAETDFPGGVVVPVDCGRFEGAELEAQLGLLRRRPELAARIGARAREHVLRHHDSETLAARLVAFLEELAARPASEAVPEPEQAPFELADLVAELRRACVELGLDRVPEDARALAVDLLALR